MVMPESKKITRLSNAEAYPLMLSYLMLVLTLQSKLYLWLSLIAILFVLWRFLFQIHKTSLPTTGVLNLLALVCCALIFYFSLTEGVLSGMTNLLLIGTAMKLLAIRSATGVKQLCLSIYFIIAATFIFKQGLGFTGFVFAIFILNTYTLIVVHSPALSFNQRFRYSLKFFATSAPLILFLFALMPRLDPLWKMPTASGSATGLSENINPGDFSSLAQSPELAFRVTFDGDIPEQRDLYWRTMVHEQFDGKQWVIHPFRKNRQNRTPVKASEYQAQNNVLTHYQVMMEPTFQTWLYALDTPVSHSNQLDYHQDRLLSNPTAVAQKFQYRVTSAARHQHKKNTFELEREINLELPPNTNPRAVALAKELRQQSGSELAFLTKVLSYFETNEFVYTLEPPLLPVDPVDTFLFETRAGFCSHFASSFAVLMRAGGIPARIVSGYQGGEAAQSGEYLTVRQYEAHAWNEVWLEKGGWIRIDPTAVVSPERINSGLQAAMRNEDSFLSGALFDLTKYREFAVANWLRNQLNNMDFYWSSWVLNFDRTKQNNLFESLWGKQDSIMFSIYSAIILTSFIGFIYFLARRQQFRHTQTALFAVHQQITHVGKRFDFTRPISMPPLTFLSEFAEQQPQLAPDIDALRRYYNQCLYQDLDDEQYAKTLVQIKVQIKRLKQLAPRKIGRFTF